MKKTFRVITWGGLGDVLLTTPTFKALKQKHKDCKIIVYGHSEHHREIFRHNPYVDQIRNTKFLSNPTTYIRYYLKWAKFHNPSYGHLTPSLCYKRNARDLIAEMFDVQLTDRKIQVYLTTEEKVSALQNLSRYKNPVAIHISSITSKNQEWPVSNWEQLVREMPEYTFIQLGLSTEPKVEGAIDMRGKTSFREALAIIDGCKSFVGVVSSFAHATNAFDIPGVILFGASTPDVWGHENNINLYKGLPCAPCIDMLNASPCPYNKKCMTSISLEEVKQALWLQMKGKETVPMPVRMRS